MLGVELCQKLGIQPNSIHGKHVTPKLLVALGVLLSVEPHIVLNLHPTTKDSWAYLKHVYNEQNFGRRFQLEHLG